MSQAQIVASTKRIYEVIGAVSFLVVLVGLALVWRLDNNEVGWAVAFTGSCALTVTLLTLGAINRWPEKVRKFGSERTYYGD